MRYSFGVPAWLGTLRVWVVLFALPALFAVAGSWLARSQFGWSGTALKLTYFGAFVFVFIAQSAFMVWRARSSSRKLQAHDRNA